MKSQILLVILFSVFLIVSSRVREVYLSEPVESGLKYNQYQYWFTGQLLDHFNPLDNRTFSQRYWVVPDYYDPATGPVFMYICGEYTCPGVNPSRLYPVMVAQQKKALIVVLEHRYYGKSLPLGNASLATENLNPYLTRRGQTI